MPVRATPAGQTGHEAATRSPPAGAGGIVQVVIEQGVLAALQLLDRCGPAADYDTMGGIPGRAVRLVLPNSTAELGVSPVRLHAEPLRHLRPLGDPRPQLTVAPPAAGPPPRPRRLQLPPQTVQHQQLLGVLAVERLGRGSRDGHPQRFRPCRLRQLRLLDPRQEISRARGWRQADQFRRQSGRPRRSQQRANVARQPWFRVPARHSLADRRGGRGPVQPQLPQLVAGNREHSLGVGGVEQVGCKVTVLERSGGADCRVISIQQPRANVHGKQSVKVDLGGAMGDGLLPASLQGS